MKKITKKKRKHSRLVLVIIMSAIVFSLIAVSTFGLFSVYAIVNKVSFLNFEMLPRYSGTYILGIISVFIGIFLATLFRKYILIPLHSSYIALGKVTNGDFDVSVEEKGIRAVRNVAKSVNAMAKELDTVETMRNDFINNFSHEFKTPIISISGFAKMLKNADLSPEERGEYLDIIISESERLSQLSTNILNLTKLDNQSILTNTTEFNVTEQLRLAIILLEQKWTEKNITMNFECDEYLIIANEELLSQVWINLIDNAIKFSPRDSEIAIEIKKSADSLIFSFRDSGKGMDEETAKHVFDRFFQGDISHKSTGYGIGLAMSKKICELHKGDIIVKSTGENGTVFEVILPAEK